MEERERERKRKLKEKHERKRDLEKEIHVKEVHKKMRNDIKLTQKKLTMTDR